MIGLTVGWVAVYSYVVDPGHAAGHYEDYAQRVSPVICLAISAPVFGAFAFLCARRGGPPGARFARTTTLVYLAIDAAVLALVPGSPADKWPVWSAAAALKLGAVLLGGRLGARAADARA